jgi:uncharacterized membrane protein
MSDYLFLAPITFIAILAAVVGFYMKFSADRDERRNRR